MGAHAGHRAEGAERGQGRQGGHQREHQGSQGAEEQIPQPRGGQTGVLQPHLHGEYGQESGQERQRSRSYAAVINNHFICRYLVMIDYELPRIEVKYI